MATTRKLDVDTAVRKMQENADKKIAEMNQ